MKRYNKIFGSLLITSVLFIGCGGLGNQDPALEDDVEDTSDGKADGIPKPLGTYRDLRGLLNPLNYFDFNLLVLKSDKTFIMRSECPPTAICAEDYGLTEGTFKFTKSGKSRFIRFYDSYNDLVGRYEYKWNSAGELLLANAALKPAQRWKNPGVFTKDGATPYCLATDDCLVQGLTLEDAAYSCQNNICVGIDPINGPCSMLDETQCGQRSDCEFTPGNCYAYCRVGDPNCCAPGTCSEKSAEGKFCGGIAGFPCPDGYQCVDNPNDSCDPNLGGADCGGMCTKDKNCPIGGLVCMLYCPYGMATDENGCEICACLPSPQPICPLTGVMCIADCPASGKTANGVPCQKGNYNAATCSCDPVVSPSACVVSGCSGEICASEPMYSTCDAKPWIQCLQYTECGNFGANGECGWKETQSFTSCMAQF